MVGLTGLYLIEIYQEHMLVIDSRFGVFILLADVELYQRSI
jgi:hypothetical protein